MVKYAPYPPDPVARDFYLFGKLYFPIRGMRYADVPAIQKACVNIFWDMPSNDLKSSFEKLLSRASERIEAEWDYLE